MKNPRVNKLGRRVGTVLPPRPVNKRPYPKRDIQQSVNYGGALRSFIGLRSNTPTVTGTGVTTTSGGQMPGAPGDPYGAPKIKNWAKATPAQIAQSMLAPEYAQVASQENQWRMMSQQQQAAITSYGLDLAKILGTAGPGGQLPTLGPNYAAALSMAAIRNFAYQQFLQTQKFADARAEIAAKYPTYLNQIISQRAEEKLKQDAFNFQKIVAAQTYGLNKYKAQTYARQADTRNKQSAQRIALAKNQYELSVAKAQNDAANDLISQEQAQARIDLAKKNYNLQVWKANHPYKPSSSSSSGGKDKLRGLTQTQYRTYYGESLKNAASAKRAGVNRKDYVAQAVMNGIPRWVAQKAWGKPKKKSNRKAVSKKIVGG